MCKEEVPQHYTPWGRNNYSSCNTTLILLQITFGLINFLQEKIKKKKEEAKIRQLYSFGLFDYMDKVKGEKNYFGSFWFVPATVFLWFGWGL